MTKRSRVYLAKKKYKRSHLEPFAALMDAISLCRRAIGELMKPRPIDSRRSNYLSGATVPEGSRGAAIVPAGKWDVTIKHLFTPFAEGEYKMVEP